MTRGGVMVLGMHRSGTSVVTQVLSALGLSLCRDDDLILGDAANPAGYAESRTVVACNELLLAASDSYWWCPPTPAGSPVEHLSPVQRALADAFESVHPSVPWVCKDPRLCLTVDVWWRALAARPVAVVVLRNPLEIARSLEEQNGLPIAYGLTLWERYLREVVRMCEGATVYLDEYERLLAAPEEWCAGMARFLDSAGLARSPDGDAAAILVRPGLHRHVASERCLHESGVVSRRQRDLYRVLRAQRGAHGSWRAPELGPEPATVNALFEAVRRTPAFAEVRGLVLGPDASGWAPGEPVQRLRAALGSAAALRSCSGG